MTSLTQATEIPIEQLFDELKSSTDGLTSTEAKNRLEKYGYNELAEKKVNPFLVFLTYFWGPMPWMIEITIVLCALVQDWVDFGIITLLLVGNGAIGFFEERSAEDAVAALKAGVLTL